jgi:hypothetical protein
VGRRGLPALIPLPVSVVRALDESAQGRDSGPLMLRPDGLGPVNEKSLRMIVRNLGKGAGVAVRVLPETLRVSCIVNGLDSGAAVRKVADLARASTPCGTTTRACSSVTERASRRFSSASDTRARLRRSTPTAICGRTRMSGRARLWTPSSVLLRTLCGLRRRWDHERAGHRPVAEGLVCRPGSVPGRLAAFRSATIHLGPPLPAASCGPPAHSGGQPSNVRCSTLLRAGFAEPARSPGPLVVSCTTVSPLPARKPAVCSLWHFPADRSGWVLPTALP